VLAGKNALVSEIVLALRSRGIPAQVVTRQSPIRITEPSVKVLTMHSAKGLDFPHVYLVGLTSDGIPGGDLGTREDTSAETRSEVIEMQRRLLYTAMIRAGQSLTMTTITGLEHPLLADLDERFCHRERVMPS
jgi:superfamily I DNA/RNA helicase